MFSIKRFEKSNNLPISPLFNIGDLVPIEVNHFDSTNNRLVSKKELFKIKKIRVIAEIASGTETHQTFSNNLEIEQSVQYLVLSMASEGINSDKESDNNNLVDLGHWISEDSLIA